jgi:ribonuclease J
MDPVMGPIGGWGDIYTTVGEAAANPRGFCLQMGYEGLPNLIDLRPPPGSVYIHSNGTPLGTYDPTWAVMLAWVENFKLEMTYLGCSGHARQEDIERQVRDIAPGVVLPVHSTNPYALRVEGVRTLLPEVGRAYSSQELRLARNL